MDDGYKNGGWLDDGWMDWWMTNAWMDRGVNAGSRWVSGRKESACY